VKILRYRGPASRDRRLAEAWEALLEGAADALHFHPEPAGGEPEILFPGAFNPLHEGHLRMAALARRRRGAEPHFELSVANVDKATIGREEAFARLAQFAATHSVVVTRAPTFLEKSRLFPGATFVVGIDTVVRIGETRYYPSEAACREALAAITDAGNRFLVFGRRAGADRFLTLGDVALPPVLARLCEEVPEAEFRMDVSSTALREAHRQIE